MTTIHTRNLKIHVEKLNNTKVNNKYGVQGTAILYIYIYIYVCVCVCVCVCARERAHWIQH